MLITPIEEKIIRKIIGKQAEYERCETDNMRIKGHIEHDQFQKLMAFSDVYNVCLTLGKDGVLVIHD